MVSATNVCEPSTAMAEEVTFSSITLDVSSLLEIGVSSKLDNVSKSIPSHRSLVFSSPNSRIALSSNDLITSPLCTMLLQNSAVCTCGLPLVLEAHPAGQT